MTHVSSHLRERTTQLADRHELHTVPQHWDGRVETAMKAAGRNETVFQLVWLCSLRFGSITCGPHSQPAKLTVSSFLNINQSAVPPLPSYAPTPALGPEQQWFYAGACVDTVLRTEAIPNRTFYAQDTQTVRNPFDAIEEAGVNAARVTTSQKLNSTPTESFNNTGDVLNRERNFGLDSGNIDIRVLTAGLVKERGMKLVHTINMPPKIPSAWQQYNYSQMLVAIGGEVRRQLVPFLQAGIQPDILLFETEGSAGFLFTERLPDGEDHDRGVRDASVSSAKLKQECCGQLPTGHINSYPQLAGYYKQEVLSCRDAMQQAGFDPDMTRYGLHSHEQYINWKQSLVYNTTDPNLELSVNVNGTNCSFEGIIPQNLLDLRAADMLDIMGWSAYANPLHPESVASNTSLNATLDDLRQTLSLMDSVVSRYGRYSSGPFVGQYRKQGLAVEFGSQFHFPDKMEAQQHHTDMFFGTLQTRPWMLGALWWEPTKAYNNWGRDSASLYHMWSSDRYGTNEAPTPTLAYWGSFSRSP